MQRPEKRDRRGSLERKKQTKQTLGKGEYENERCSEKETKNDKSRHMDQQVLKANSLRAKKEQNKTKTQNTKHKTQNTKHKTQNKTKQNKTKQNKNKAKQKTNKKKESKKKEEEEIMMLAEKILRNPVVFELPQHVALDEKGKSPDRTVGMDGKRME